MSRAIRRRALRHRAGRRRGHADALGPAQAAAPAVRPGDGAATCSTASATSPLDRAVVVVGHGAERVTKKLTEDGAGLPLEFVEQHVPAGHRRRRRRRPHRPSPTTTTTTTATSSCCPATRRCCGPRPSPRWSPSTAPPAPPARPHRPRSTTPPATAASCAARTTGSPASSSTPTPPPTSSTIDEINTSIYCFRRSLLAPALRRVEPRQRPGRVLPHRRRRGARRRRPPGRRAWSPTTPTRPRASTTGPSWPSPRPSCGAAPTSAWLRAGRHDGRPRPPPTSTPPSAGRRRHAVPRHDPPGPHRRRRGRRDRARHPAGRLLGRRATPIVEQTVGRDAEIGADCVVGPYAVLEPGAQMPSGTRTGPFYTATGAATT